MRATIKQLSKYKINIIEHSNINFLTLENVFWLTVIYNKNSLSQLKCYLSYVMTTEQLFNIMP